ncbi:tyrosine-type recombinase/integrase [Pseudomonas sp. 21LCFQ010]|uniref:tyrosine-type recombinase/integrase n=1 Tax=Pseudomonas sp. 21LCFQ010 TaxID=2957506 RepID=UPI002096BC98|nr:tyrosine-type recombinase/integrase [Pseudomonas sp. 21LCFQ010]MCO8164813.1 tyrosine-type recombinase/integrase [Pseudomonas sp. 21LCFQ010]
MRPRNPENRNLPPRMLKRTRTRKSGKVWTAYYYRTQDGKDIPLGTDINLARLKWADLEAKSVPVEMKLLCHIFDRYRDTIIPRKSPRSQSDNLKELKFLRAVFDSAPIDAITPAMIAGYRDARKGKVRANREIALFSHIFNTAREWGLTERANPCQGVRKNKEKPRDYYATDLVWDAVYSKASQDLKDAMDMAYLTGQRPADVRLMRRDDVQGSFLLVTQQKTSKRLRIELETDGMRNRLGLLIDELNSAQRCRNSPYFFVSQRGQKMSSRTLNARWVDARNAAIAAALEEGNKPLASKLSEFQFRDIRPKAASEIEDIGDASRLLGHSKQDITEKVYRRIGAIAKPSR